MPCFASDLKVGFFDIQKVFQSIKEGKAVLKKLESRFNVKKKTLKNVENKIKKASENFKKQSLVLSDKAKMTKERELQGMIMQLQKKTMEAQQDINKLKQKLEKPIMDKIQKVVAKVSKKAGVALTFELSTSPVIYAATRIDLSDEIIKAYGKK